MLGALIAISTGGGLVLGAQVVGASTPPPTVTGMSSSGYNYSFASTAGGQPIIIYGTNLVDVTAIDFGSIPGTDIQCFGDTCDVVAPPAAMPSTVFVTVTTAGGTSATYNGAGDELIYRYPTNLTAAPAILSVSPLTLSLLTLTATLTGPHGPVSGANVTFTVQISPARRDSPGSFQTLCTTTTNSKGVATCAAASSALQLIDANGYRVGSDPTATQLPTFGTAPLLIL
ncbi:MAG TPA: hypothetical protein VG298_05690 [Acidimicrobiales bacterium]|nr:hypothetical protein [Acidimicrobiales bacterium]